MGNRKLGQADVGTIATVKECSHAINLALTSWAFTLSVVLAHPRKQRMILLYQAEFSAAVHCPRLFGAGRIGRHFTAEADSLDEVGIHSGIDE